MASLRDVDEVMLWLRLVATGCRNSVCGRMDGVEGVCRRVWKEDGWMRMSEEENDEFLFSQLGDRSKRPQFQ